MNSCNDGDSDSSDKAEGARRKYFQCKQREYRHRLKNERAGLLEALARMQSQLSKLPPTKLVSDDGKLSWKVVAAVFQEESKQSKEKLHRLQDLVDSNSSLIFEIMRFLRACKPRPGPIISEEQPMDYNVTLMANGAARLHAKQWLVQQLYHNTSRIFHSFPVTDASDEFTQIRAECSGPWVHIVERTQILFPYPLEDVKRFFLHPQSQEIICLTDEIDVERDGNTVLAHGRFNDAVGWHLLQGHFFEADRFVVVHRHIYDDEAVEGSGDPDYHEMEWFDVRRISPTQSLVRIIGHRTMLIKDVKEFATEMGATVTTHDKKTTERQVEAFSRHLSTSFQTNMSKMLVYCRSSTE